MKTFIPQWQMDSGTGISGAYLKIFKQDLKGDRVVAGLTMVEQQSSTDEGREASHSSRVKLARSACSLKYLYTNEHSMGNRQEELEILVWTEDYRLVTETWWDSLHAWSMVMDGHVLLRKARKTRWWSCSLCDRGMY